MGRRFQDFEVTELAAWLSDRAEGSLWTVDGEPNILGAINLPCPGPELAGELARRGEKVRIFEPEGSGAKDRNDLEDWADREDGDLVFELSWLTEENKPSGQPWILAEDSLAREAQQELQGAA